MAIGSVEPLRRLYARWGDEVTFLDVLVRQAHPGQRVPHYAHFEQKRADAQAYRRDERIPWPVLVDDVPGSVHQAYGAVANASYLLGADGRIAFASLTTGVPKLHGAIEALLAQGGSGVVRGGLDRVLHLLPTLTDGWRAVARGQPQSVADLGRALPAAPAFLRLGARLRPVLAPLARRAVPVSLPMRASGWTAVALAASAVWRRWAGRARSSAGW